MTDAESHLWNKVLKDDQMLGYAFDRRIKVLDQNAAFLSLKLRLIIEIDSGSVHQKEDFRKAAEKELLFRLGGYTVLRFSESEILTNSDKVRSMIKEWIVLNVN